MQPIVTDGTNLEPQAMSVKVTNRNEFKMTDRFDGVPYTFEPNVPVSIPIDAANHIFGYYPPYRDDEGDLHQVDPNEMRRHIVKRFGWNTPSMQENGRGERFYANLEIVPIIYRMVPVQVDESGEPVDNEIDPLPTREPIPRGPKTNRVMAAAAESAARA